MEIVSIEQSKIEGMDAIESRRRVAAMDTVLSKDPLDESEPGYQFCKAAPKEPEAEEKRENRRKERTQKEEKKQKEKKRGPRQYNTFNDEKREDK
jgi:hypothetical protein